MTEIVKPMDQLQLSQIWATLDAKWERFVESKLYLSKIFIQQR